MGTGFSGLSLLAQFCSVRSWVSCTLNLSNSEVLFCLHGAASCSACSSTSPGCTCMGSHGFSGLPPFSWLSFSSCLDGASSSPLSLVHILSLVVLVASYMKVQPSLQSSF